MKKSFLLSIAFASIASIASAATYSISLTQDGLGDASPDWFGTFEADASNVITSFNIVVDGTTYDTPGNLTLGSSFGTDVLVGNATAGPITTSGTPALNFSGIGQGNPDGSVTVTRPWQFGTCSQSTIFPSTSCGYSSATGTYDFTKVVGAQIPLPASGLLLIGALGAIASLRRKRRT